MIQHGPHFATFLWLLGIIAVTSILSGTLLAFSNYSASAPFTVAGGCVGVLATLATQEFTERTQHDSSSQFDS